MQEPVLVLNANFEPIHVCSTRRAIGLILAGKAGMIANGRGHIRTISQLIPRPSVIRLENQIHRPRPRVPGALVRLRAGRDVRMVGGQDRRDDRRAGAG